jgi:hypothetical protein
MARWPANWPLLGASRTALQHAIKVGWDAVERLL